MKKGEKEKKRVSRGKEEKLNTLVTLNFGTCMKKNVCMYTPE